MIVRETDTAFIMIEQHDHATISKQLFDAVKIREDLGYYEHSIRYAIKQHDRGWIPYDEAPLWNDAKNRPFDFINFSLPKKTSLYTTGIDEVCNEDLYAALLCSEHYARFLQSDRSQEAQQFVQQEHERQQMIIEQLNKFDDCAFQHHYELLQFFDNVSLYLCVNEPGVDKHNEHPFFKAGINVPPLIGEGNIHFNWVAHHIVTCDFPLFMTDITINLYYKYVVKHAINQHGLNHVYEATPYSVHPITLQHTI